MKEKLSENLKEKIKLFLKIFVVLFLIVITLAWLSHYFEVKNNKTIVEIQAQEHIGSAERVIINDFKTVISDIHVLIGDQEFHHLFKYPDDKEGLVKEFLSFTESKDLYDQARFLDNDGMEIIRVNRKDNKAYLVPDSELQSKSERYYFINSINLKKGEVYISPFDLNVEQDVIEEPFKPMVRFSSPVFDNEGKKRGLVVLNYLGQKLISDFKIFTAGQLSEVCLVNSEYYWLVGPDPEAEWGFMFEDKKDEKFGKMFPAAFEEIKEKESGQFYTSKGLFTFKKVYPVSKAVNNNYYWVVVDYVSWEILNEQIAPFLKRLLMIIGFSTLFILIVSWSLAHSRIQHRIAEKKIFELNEILRLLNKILRHDILGDLTVVQGNISMYQEQQDQNLINDALAAVKRAIELIDEMRFLESAISSGEKLRLYQLSQVIDEVRKKFPKINITIKGDGRVMADKALFSVIGNIIKNAETHAKVDKIDILIKEIGGFIEMHIVDYGKGIPDKIKDKLFQEGFKYGETGNTGLGLYIVRKTMERYGGKVEIADNKPKGAVFILYFSKVNGS